MGRNPVPRQSAYDGGQAGATVSVSLRPPPAPPVRPARRPLPRPVKIAAYVTIILVTVGLAVSHVVEWLPGPRLSDDQFIASLRDPEQPYKLQDQLPEGLSFSSGVNPLTSTMTDQELWQAATELGDSVRQGWFQELGPDTNDLGTAIAGIRAEADLVKASKNNGNGWSIDTMSLIVVDSAFDARILAQAWADRYQSHLELTVQEFQMGEQPMTSFERHYSQKSHVQQWWFTSANPYLGGMVVAAYGNVAIQMSTRLEEWQDDIWTLRTLIDRAARD